MATVLLGIGGQVLGSAIGGPFGALLGRAIGAVAGAYVDQTIVNALTPPREGPRLTTTDIQTSTEGTAITRLAGRVRIPGQVFWATRFEERSTRTGGKGMPSGPVTIEYSYYGNFAVGLCEGPIAGIGRVWADGKEIDQTQTSFRVYRGTDTQMPDPLIAAKEGAAPAYRGLAYVVFEGLPLANWGNRLPQMTFEVFRPVGDAEKTIQGVALLPGNEFGFDPERVDQVKPGGNVSENRHTLIAGSDWTESIDRLQRLMPSVGNVLLVVPWYGDDLRVGSCTVQPCVDAGGKTTTPHSWTVSSTDRASAKVVSYVNGAAAYGGTPSDASLLRCLADLKRRGLKVTLLPFLMMDVPAGNTKPDPYSGASSQPTYPWRGRITCYPAPGRPGSPDKSAAAATSVNAFLGSAAPGHFAAAGAGIVYSGPAEWSYRRFILHYAHLARASGAVDSLLIGSEMIGLTQLRSAAANYPFVEGLKTLAADVRSIVGAGVKLGYAADWSEYNSHRPADGSNDLYFPLDGLWSHAAIDFVGIDNYLPLSDWRDEPGHLDYDPVNGPTSIYDQIYLAGNVRGGQDFDWYYASDADRAAQVRSPITDGAYGKPWVFAQKAIREWWENAHYNRPAGVEAGTATSWVPQSKPIRFIELGCPAVDKGSNQPNVFPDPKSSENALPHFSTGQRDDQMQRAYIEAMLGFYADPANNPVSGVYGGRMLDLSRSNVWCWDVRPTPSFPLDDRWGDWANFETGHWISTRMGSVPGREGLAWLLDGVGFTQRLIEPLPGTVDGITIGEVTSARSVLEALMGVYQFDAVESDGLIKFIARPGRRPVRTIDTGDLVAAENVGAAYRLTRGQETELPVAVKVRYGDWAREDQAGQAEARRSTTISRKVLTSTPPVTMPSGRARQIAEDELRAAWVGRERASFSLPPSSFALDPGDVVELAPVGLKLRLSTIGAAEARSVEAFAVETLTGGAGTTPEPQPPAPLPVLLDPVPVFVDGPLLTDDDPPHAGYVAGIAKPWGQGLAVFRSETDSGFALDTLLTQGARVGELLYDFWSGPTGRWDQVNTCYVTLLAGTLSSAEQSAVLNGANPLLVENVDGEWELLQFTSAELIGERQYALRGLLRGQRGTEHAMRAPVAAGARVLAVDGAVSATGLPADLAGLSLYWRVGPASQDIGSPDYATQLRTIAGKGRRPLAPCQVRGRRNTGNGDWTLSWVRRTRLGGDSWDQTEVPLGEASEAYQVQILSGPGGTVKRTFTPTSASQLYTAAQQAADFGSAQWSFTARVAQVSATWGPGIFEEVLIWVR